jgi:hypothetical protein
MPRKLTNALLVPLCAALLASCATVERVIRPPLVIPPSLLICAEFPVEPDPDTASDVDLAVFMLRGEDAWRDCRDTLADVADLVSSQEGN